MVFIRLSDSRAMFTFDGVFGFATGRFGIVIDADTECDPGDASTPDRDALTVIFFDPE